MTTSSADSGCAPGAASIARTCTPATAEPFCEVADSVPQDIELALDAAHAAKDAWGRRRLARTCKVLDAIADAMDANLEMLAVAESWENGKPVRETLAADMPLAIDHFRYFADAVRGEEGWISEIDEKIRSPTTSASRSAWSGRSSRSTSRC